MNSYKLLESIEYLEEKLKLREKIKNFKIENKNVLNLIKVFECLKRIIRKKPLDSEEVQLIKTEVDKLLYEYKSFEYNGKDKVVGILNGVMARKAEKMSVEEIKSMISSMKSSLKNNPDYMIQYIIDKFKYLKKLLDEKEGQKPVKESFEYSNYLDKVSEFDNLVESIFFGNEEPSLKDFIKLNMLTEGLINYEEREEFVDTIKKAKQKVLNQLEENLVSGKGSTPGIIFNLKNNYNWVDKQEIKAEVDQDITINIDIEE